ncbi:hypothetical protein MVEN_01424100 [Mycena venus]|uniref:Uncharacterized protein n=1 Tax=Mycena venus TaxID=2733690 RepID=A0A8H6XZB0_9AGAR|nr:hypothetical protein MVEN_01424100 [Mycena venus]
MSASPLLAIIMAAVVGETLLYGAVLVLFLANFCIRGSWYTGLENTSNLRWNPVFLICTIIPFLCCSAHWLLSIARFFHVLLHSSNVDSVQRSYEHYSRLANAGEIINFVMTCFGDAVIIHRLWIIWNRSLRVTIPAALLWIALFVFGSITQHLILHPPLPPNQQHKSLSHTMSAVPIRSLRMANFTITVVTNIYCTALIAYRVWSNTQGRRELRSMASILIESAALYTAWTLFATVCYQLRSNILVFATILISQVIGLTNMLLYLRFGIERRPPAHTQDDTGVVLTSIFIENSSTPAHEYRISIQSPESGSDKSGAPMLQVSFSV